MRRSLAPALLAASLAGCALGPEVRPPEVAAPANHRGLAGEATVASLADVAWWDLAGKDAALAKLLAEAVRGNRDLAVAAARVAEYRALSRVDPRLPTVEAGASAGRERTSEAVRNVPGGRTSNALALSASVAWEVDLWGRLRRSREASAAQYLATEEARRGVYVSLVAEVATGYLNLRALDRQLDVARRTLESRTASLDLIGRQLRGGVASRLESSQATAAVAQTEAAIPQLAGAVSAQENGLSLLLGRAPGPIERGAPIDATLEVEVPAGLPSELLTRRPDVRQAEQALRAADAALGVARASLFPQLSLTGSLGFQSAELSELLKSGSFAWGFGAGLLAPLFQGGKLRRNVEAARARREEAGAQYEKAALAAFGDAATALDAVRRSREVVSAQRRNVEVLREVERLALLRFEGGVSPYLEVLDAQRTLFAGELAFAEALRDQRVALVRLYKALGGGWSHPETPPAP